MIGLLFALCVGATPYLEPQTRPEDINSHLAVSPNGRRLVTSDLKGISVWDLSVRQRLRRVALPWRAQRVVWAGPDAVLVDLGDQTVNVDVRTGEVTAAQTLPPPPPLPAMAWPDGAEHFVTSANGEQVAFESNFGIEVWRAGSRTRAWRESASNVAALGFTPDGGTLFAAGTYRFEAWDTVEGTLQHTFGGTVRRPGVAAFSRDGRWLALAPHSGKVSLGLLDTASGEWSRLATLNSSIRQIVWTPDSRGLFAVTDVHLLHVVLGGDRLRHRVLKPSGKAVRSIVLSPTGSHFAGIRDGTAQLFDAETGEVVGPALAHRGSMRVEQLTFSPDGGTLFTGTRKEIAAWDVAAFSPRWVVDARGTSVVHVQPNGTVALREVARETWLDGATGAIVARFPDDGPLPGDGRPFLAMWAYAGAPIRPLSARPPLPLGTWRDGQRVALGPPPYIGLPLNPGDLGLVVRSPDDTRLVTSVRDGTLIVWNAQTGEERVRFAFFDGDDGVEPVTWTTDGHWDGSPAAVAEGLVFSENGVKLAHSAAEVVAQQVPGLLGQQF